MVESSKTSPRPIRVPSTLSLFLEMSATSAVMLPLDILEVNGYVTVSCLQVYISWIMLKHTWGDQEMLKRATKNHKPNFKKMLNTFITLSLKMRVSIYFRLRPSYIYDRGHFILSETVFKKYFLRWAPFPTITSIYSWQVSLKIAEQLKSFRRKFAETSDDINLISV